MKIQLLTGIALVVLSSSALHAEDEFDKLRERFVMLLTGGPKFSQKETVQKIASQVASNGKSRSPGGTGFWDTMEEGGGPAKNRLWRETGRLSANYRNVEQSIERLHEMALAYSIPTSPLYKNPELARDILWALSFCFEQNYNEKIEHKSYENWFALELGIPLKLLPTLAMMYDEIPPDVMKYYLSVVDKLAPYPDKIGGHHQPATGANLAWKARVVAMSAILGKDPDRLSAAAKAIDPIFENTTSGDGWYDDGSFVQHRYFAYTGGYGTGAIGEPLLMAQMLEGSPWALEPEKLRVLIDRLELGYAPLVVDGELMDMVRGREIARDGMTSINAGRGMIRIYARAYDVAPDEAKPMIASRIKQWVQAGDYFQTSATRARLLYDEVLVREISELPLPPAEAPRSHHVFAAMDRVVHRAGDWSAGLSLYSARIAPYESINGENRRGWHTSSGHLALFNGDRRQFVDGFWPTVNAYRLPGTTVVAGAEPKGERSKARFVGGVVGPDGISGMAVLDLNVVPEGDPSARKAWVFLENEIVCLGSAIRSNTGEVETIVENRKLGSNAQASFVTEPATPMLTVQNAPGTPVVLKNISYAHLEEGGGLPGIGYVFPKPVDLSAIRESRTDTWKSINVTSLLSIDEKPITNEFLTLWLNHGFSPKDASYEYILLPRATEKETAAYAAAPSVQILSNTPDLQAVSSRGGKFLAIAFWDPKGGTLVAGQQTVKLDGPGLVIIDEGPNGIRVAIADPSQLGASPLTLQIGRRFSRIEQADPSIEKGATDGALRFDPSGLRGRTASAVLR